MDTSKIKRNVKTAHSSSSSSSSKSFLLWTSPPLFAVGFFVTLASAAALAMQSAELAGIQNSYRTADTLLPYYGACIAAFGALALSGYGVDVACLLKGRRLSAVPTCIRLLWPFRGNRRQSPVLHYAYDGGDVAVRVWLSRAIAFREYAMQSDRQERCYPIGRYVGLLGMVYGQA